MTSNRTCRTKGHVFIKLNENTEKCQTCSVRRDVKK